MIDNPTLKAIRERRSTLDFTSEPVTDEQVEAILEAGRWAPSALNSQPWDFVVVRDPQLRTGIAIILRRITWAWGGFARVPVMIVVSVDPSRDPDHFVEAGAVATQNLCLAAQSLGLASSWAGVYGSSRAAEGNVEQDLKAVLSMPRAHRIIAVVPIGVAQIERESYRRPLAEIVHPDRFRSLPGAEPEEAATPHRR
jgi:nitroreductase